MLDGKCLCARLVMKTESTYMHMCACLDSFLSSSDYSIRTGDL